ncbi:acyl-CoA transferase [uncultured Amaricoccus sp.]|uniref:acyl-CoA transferase n=1 Tax=uncultured Amaricoccus sp. TaxID=339341 RepID=UPI002639516B|nr:acyl-CoA transferase [uncultured Amaricoccus sp.]
MSKSEQVLAALFAALGAHLPGGVKLLRNAVLPERIPAGGVAILRDGEPGEPEFLFSPALYLYEHRAEIDLVVEASIPAARDAAFDALKLAVGVAIANDRTLGKLCDWVQGEAPASEDLPVEDAEGLKAATLGVILSYATSDPLS